MKILITGHDGYIGSVMSPLFRADGHEVHGLDTEWFRDCGFGEEPPGDVATWSSDIRDANDEEFCDRFQGFDAVIHLAALSNDPLGNLSPENTREINHRAAVRIARLTRRAGISRFVFSSSCSLYGAAGDDELDESAPMNPVTPYGETKIQAEQDIGALASESFSPTFLRNATAYGLSPQLRADLVVNNLVGYAVTTGEVLIMSDGSPWRPLVHVEDIGRAFLAVLRTPRAQVHNEAFNIGRPGDNYRVREIAVRVQSAVPGSQVRFADGASPDRRNYRVDFSKAARLLPEFKPWWTLQAGIEQLREAYTKHGLTTDQFLSRRYHRVAQIRQLCESGAIDDTLRWARSPLTAPPLTAPPLSASRQSTPPSA
jgi:nucleoside-diphosphate-sugar epimerase